MHLRRGIAQRSSRDFDGSDTDEILQPLSRKRGHGSREGTIEAPTRMGGLQANIDRLTSPHEQEYGSERARFNVPLGKVLLTLFDV
jgi:hypothetical protein